MKNFTGKWLTFFCVSAAPFFFIGGPGYHSSRAYNSIWNFGHVLFFTLFSYLLFAYLQRNQQGWSRLSALGSKHNMNTAAESVVSPGLKSADDDLQFLFLRGFFAVLTIGIIIELTQMVIVGRLPDIYDILRNQLGCLIAYLLLCSQRDGFSFLQRLYLQICVLVLLGFSLWPLTKNIYDEILAERQFPLLSDFESPFEKDRWVNKNQLAIDKEIVRHGKRSLRVKLSTAEYSGTSLFYFPADWHNYRTMFFSVYNPLPEALPFHCRIHDKLHRSLGNNYHDRFHRKFLLKPGWNDIEISLKSVRSAPATREMDMEKIERVGFFVVRQPHPLTIFIDNVYLGK